MSANQRVQAACNQAAAHQGGTSRSDAIRNAKSKHPGSTPSKAFGPDESSDQAPGAPDMMGRDPNQQQRSN